MTNFNTFYCTLLYASIVGVNFISLVSFVATAGVGQRWAPNPRKMYAPCPYDIAELNSRKTAIHVQHKSASILRLVGI